MAFTPADIAAIRARYLAAQASATATSAPQAANVNIETTQSEPASVVVPPQPTLAAIAVAQAIAPAGQFQGAIEWNQEQQQFINLFRSGKSCVLIGPAGCGKTTVTKGAVLASIDDAIYGPLKESTKVLSAGSPSVVAVSFTRRAVRNLRLALGSTMASNVWTIHKLLEFAPVFYEVMNEKGETVNKMRFEPTRNRFNPLPRSLRSIVFDESSMVSVELHQMLLDALPDPAAVQMIYIGDLQQLPPVYGSAILGYKMLSLPIVELIHVYRQALESPIIKLAHHILHGKTIPEAAVMQKYNFDPARVPDAVWKEALKAWNVPGKMTLHPWKRKVDAFMGLKTMQAQICQWFDMNKYIPETDMILVPFNKDFGSIELNAAIAQHIGAKRGAVVHEVIAGFNKYYLAVGDRVMVDKEDAIITSITRNGAYLGKHFQPATTTLDRWGHEHNRQQAKDAEADQAADDIANIDDILAGVLVADSGKKEDRVEAASHIITVRFFEDGPNDEDTTLDKASELNSLLFGYVLTVHKAQGSEWRKVFVILHNAHNKMVQRELLYTSITRAREELYVICEPYHFFTGIMSQKIKGNTLAEKAVYFQGKQAEIQAKEDAQAALERGEFNEGEPAQPKLTPTISIAPSVPTTPPMRLHEFINQDFRDAAQAALHKHWVRAHSIWGADKLGAEPHLDFNLQSNRIIGLACIGRNILKLNALYCLVAQDEGADGAVWHEMLHTTMIHEICHFVADRYSNERGHNAGWRMAMKLMGEVPAQYYMGDTLPRWTEAYEDVVRKLKQKLIGNNAILVNDYNLEEGDEA